jgi:hypothetical protein
VTLSRQESKPKTVEVKPGEGVHFISAIGQTLH